MYSHFVVELHEATEMLVMVDYLRGMTVKKSCKYDKYGSFRQLLFLFIHMINMQNEVEFCIKDHDAFIDFCYIVFSDIMEKCFISK